MHAKKGLLLGFFAWILNRNQLWGKEEVDEAASAAAAVVVVDDGEEEEGEAAVREFLFLALDGTVMVVGRAESSWTDCSRALARKRSENRDEIFEEKLVLRRCREVCTFSRVLL